MYVYGLSAPLAVGLPPIVILMPEQVLCCAGPALTVGFVFTFIVLVAVAEQLKVSVTVTV
jgi:hypothetical protein